MTMTEQEIRTRLAGAVGGVAPTGDLVRDAVRGGRRRLRRRRALLTATTALVVLAVGSGVAVGRHDRVRLDQPAAVPGDYYARYLERPTGGDLADDQAFLDDAARAWTTSLPQSEQASRGLYDDLRGDPHVVWAGTFPTGRAVAVAQSVVLHASAELPANETGPSTVLGILVRDDAGTWTRVGDSWAQTGAADPVDMFGAVLDPDAGTVLVLGDGPARWSTSWDYSADVPTRSWAPVEFVDGAAVLDVPDDVLLGNVRVAREPVDSTDDTVQVSGTRTDLAEPLPWGHRLVDLDTGAVVDGQDAGGATPAERDRLFEVLTPDDPGLLDFQLDDWVVRATTPAGRSVHVVESSLDADPTRIRVVLDLDGPLPTVLDGGEVARDADGLPPLPVQVRLPDGQGWLVANLDAGVDVRWRVDGGPWTDAVGGAALLPDVPALEVEVTSDAGTLVADLTP